MTLSKPEEKCIQGRDIQMHDRNTYMIYVRHTKTIQFGERILRIPFVPSKAGVLCPISALNKLLIVCTRNKSQPLFSFRRGSKVSWWTHDTFVKKLRSLLSRAGYQPDKFSGHSFRRGGATLAFQRGLSITEVKQRGDWASSAVENYIFVSTEQIKQVANALVNG